MYVRGKAHPYKKPCVRVVRQIADGSFQERFGTPVTDSEVFQEILYRYALTGQWGRLQFLCALKTIKDTGYIISNKEMTYDYCRHELVRASK